MSVDFFTTTRSEKISVDLLNIDKEYQRLVVNSEVQKIKRGFNEKAFGVLIVGQRRDETLWIIDGQQRYMAARELGMQMLPCLVITPTTREIEANLFGLYNNGRTTISYPNSFRARLVCGDPVAKGIKACVESHGYTLGLKAKKNTSRTLAVTKELEVSYLGKDGEKNLSLVLDTIRQSWPEDPDGRSALIIGGLNIFWTQHRGPEISLARLIKVLSKVRPSYVLHYAKEDSRISGGSRHKAVCNAIVKIYNKRLRDDDRLNPI